MEEVKILLSFSFEEPSLSFDNLTRPNWLEVGAIRITYIQIQYKFAFLSPGEYCVTEHEIGSLCRKNIPPVFIDGAWFGGKAQGELGFKLTCVH